MAAILLVAGVWRAIAVAWVCDDSFISFRYAENLIAGRGLVYNAAERVEGYTNLLWTLLVASWMRAGSDPVVAAQAMGIASYALLVLLLAAWSWRRARSALAAPQDNPFSVASSSRAMDGAMLPVAAMVALAAHDFHIWASGGLETMFFTLLGVSAILLARLPASPGRAWGVGGLLAALALTRPDGLLYAPLALLSLWIAPPRSATATARDGSGVGPAVVQRSDRGRAGIIARAAIPLGVALVALVAWKLTYYGELLPTAFYSKSAASPYYTQGLRYLGLYLAKSWYLLPALVAVPLLAKRWRGPTPALDSERGDRLVFLVTAAVLVAYVLHSGGDFMFARRLIPVVPFVLLALESWIASIDRSILRWALALGLVAGAALPYPVFGEGRWRISGIADEPHFYPPEAIATRRAQGELMGELLGSTPVRAMFEGGMCMFAYYSKLPYLVEMTGLTQYSLARVPLQERGLIGHEKQPDEHWLDQHGIHLVVAQEWPISAPPPRARRHDDLYLGSLVRARVRIYSDAVMDPLRGRPEASFVPIEQVVEQLRAEMDAAPYARAAAIHDYLDRYYLRTAGPRGDAIAAEWTALVESRRRAQPTSGASP